MKVAKQTPSRKVHTLYAIKNFQKEKMIGVITQINKIE
jgi:hypothetical protein